VTATAVATAKRPPHPGLLDIVAAIQTAHASILYAEVSGDLTPEQERRLGRACRELAIAEKLLWGAVDRRRSL
jgi:hypothetical protein